MAKPKISNDEVIRELFNSVAKDTSLDINTETLESHEVDFIPKFRYSNVSELMLELSSYSEKQLFMLGVKLHEIGQFHNIYDYSKRKWKKDLSVLEYIQRMAVKINNRYSKNCFLVFDNDVDDVYLIIANPLDSPLQGIRHEIKFMSVLKEVDQCTYDFMLLFLRGMERSGVGGYWDDSMDNYLEMYQEIDGCINGYQEISKEELKDEKKRVQCVQDEINSYKNGIPQQIALEIQHSNFYPHLIVKQYNDWKKNRTIPISPKTDKEILNLCKTMEHDISVGAYEIFLGDDDYGLPLEFSKTNILDWDDGGFDYFYQESINAEFQECGSMEMADFIALHSDRKREFDHKGNWVESFIYQYQHTQIFDYFNGTFKGITSKADGAQIRSRALYEKRRRRQEKSLCGTTRNKKSTSSGRTAIRKRKTKKVVHVG